MVGVAARRCYRPGPALRPHARAAGKRRAAVRWRVASPLDDEWIDPEAGKIALCAEVYRADTYQLIRAGLVGGKGVPETVSVHPCLFVTLTAPAFGAVHVRREKNGKVLPCHARRDAETCPHGHVMSCTARHGADDPRLGEPLCPDCYDYDGSVLFNAISPEQSLIEAGSRKEAIFLARITEAMSQAEAEAFVDSLSREPNT